MDIFSRVAKALQRILNEKANELAQRHGFIQRQRKVSGSNFVKALVFG